MNHKIHKQKIITLNSDLRPHAAGSTDYDIFPNLDYLYKHQKLNDCIYIKLFRSEMKVRV